MFTEGKHFSDIILTHFSLRGLTMKDLKQTIANNIAHLRKEHGMTQLQLAERLNYSDKAISKWERGESIPDVSVLLEIAGLFSVSLDYMVNDEHNEIQKTVDEPIYREATQKIVNKNRKAILGISVQAVFLLATIVFVPISLIFPESDARWLCFIYAVPLAAIVWLVFNTLWFNRRRNYLIISVIMWSVLAAIHLTVLIFGVKIHLIYLLGVPGELIIILWSVIGKNNKVAKKP